VFYFDLVTLMCLVKLSRTHHDFLLEGSRTQSSEDRVTVKPSGHLMMLWQDTKKAAKTDMQWGLWLMISAGTVIY